MNKNGKKKCLESLEVEAEKRERTRVEIITKVEVSWVENFERPPSKRG